MTSRLNIDMYEVTRLTREGRLDEAMAMLRGQARSPEPERAAKGADVHKAIDLIPPGAGETVWTSFSQDTPAPRQHPGPEAGSLLARLKNFSLKDIGAVIDKGHARSSAPLPDGASFELRTFSAPAGSLDYKLYTPSAFSGEPLPLIVMLHGCTQSPDDFAAGTRMNELAEEQTFLVAYPAQTKSANASKCWNWFNAGDQRRGEGEPALIAGIVHQIMSDLPVDAGRIYIAGLSAGGAAAAIMGATYPELFDGIGVHSGLPCGVARDLPSAFSAMRDGGPPLRRASGRPDATGLVRTIVFHGDRDMTVNPVNGDQVIAQARAAAGLKPTTTQGTSSDGVPFTRTVERDDEGRAMLEHWVLHGAGHAWAGGSSSGSYTDPRGPDASREMVRFFLHAEH